MDGNEEVGDGGVEVGWTMYEEYGGRSVAEDWGREGAVGGGFDCEGGDERCGDDETGGDECEGEAYCHDIGNYLSHLD